MLIENKKSRNSDDTPEMPVVAVKCGWIPVKVRSK